MRSQIVIEEFYSQALEGNPLGDPVVRSVPVYLPDQTASLPRDFDPGGSLPSLYLLSSFASRGLKFLADDLWEEDIQQRLDRLIGEGQMQPMIVVMPDCSTRYGGSQYLNSPALGNYEDSLLELVKTIDGKYATRARASHRAVVGHSSGGFGAIRLGMRHPEIFGLVADHSGDAYFELGYKPDFGALLRYAERVGEAGLQDLLADPGAALRNGAPFDALNVMAMAAAYSPNAETRLGFDLPFDLHSGELRPEIWAKWLSFDPVECVGQYADALRSLKCLFIDCGRFDEYNLLYGARILTERLSALQIPFQYEEYDGGHRNVRHRYDVSFAAISAAMLS